MVIAGYYMASLLFFWLMYGEMPVLVWAPLLFLVFPFLWLTPLTIPPLMVIIVSSYMGRKLFCMAYPPPPRPAASTSGRRTFRTWKRMHSPILPVILLVLAISFVSLTYAFDYNAVQSIKVSMSVRSRTFSTEPPQVNFTVFIYVNTLNPSSEITKVIGARFTLAVDSLSAGTVTMPFDSQVGGLDARDIAYDAKFNMTGTSAQTVLQHGSNTLVLSVQFLAKGLLYQQEVTNRLTCVYPSYSGFCTT